MSLVRYGGEKPFVKVKETQSKDIIVKRMETSLNLFIEKKKKSLYIVCTENGRHSP